MWSVLLNWDIMCFLWSCEVVVFTAIYRFSVTEQGVMNCTNCGTEFEKGLSCPVCGTKMKSASKKSDSSKKAELLSMIAAIIGALVAVVVVAVLVLGKSKKPDENRSVKEGGKKEISREDPQGESESEHVNFIGITGFYVDITGNSDPWLGAVRILEVHENTLAFEFGTIDEEGFDRILLSEADIVDENRAVYEDGYGFSIEF